MISSRRAISARIGTTAVTASDISSSGDPGYYRFQLGNRSTITLSLSTATPSDLRVVIFAADGSVIEERQFGAYSAPTMKVNLAAGDYFVRVEEQSVREPYSLAISGSVAASPLAPKPPGTDLTSPVAIGTLGTTAFTVNGWVGDADPHQTYSFTLDKTSQINLTFAGTRSRREYGAGRSARCGQHCHLERLSQCLARRPDGGAARCRQLFRDGRE